MPQEPPNSGKRWSQGEEAKLVKEVQQNTPTRVIALKHGRSEEAIYAKANDLDLSLKPVNQSPYNRQKKG